MFTYALILILLLPLTLLSSTIEGLFSSDELTEMGVRLGNPQAEEAC